MTGKTVTVSIELPEPPEGWEWEAVPRSPKGGDHYLGDCGKIATSSVDWLNTKRICCRRIHKFPANAVGTFYPCSDKWWLTDCTELRRDGNDWIPDGFDSLPATVFSDFTPPPERKPYRVVNGVEVKDGAK
jgi:hypothetical protein